VPNSGASHPPRASKIRVMLGDSHVRRCHKFRDLKIKEKLKISTRNNFLIFNFSQGCQPLPVSEVLSAVYLFLKSEQIYGKSVPLFD